MKNFFILFSLFLVFGISSASAETCTDIQYGEWGACLGDVQSRDFIDFLPSGCEVVEGITPTPEVQQSCMSATPCESVTYTPWSVCDENGSQSREVSTSQPEGCDWSYIVTSTDLTQSCELTGAILTEFSLNVKNASEHSTMGVVPSIASLVSAYVPTIVGLFIVCLGLSVLYGLVYSSKHLMK